MNFKKRDRLEPRMAKNSKVRNICQRAALLQALDETGVTREKYPSPSPQEGGYF